MEVLRPRDRLISEMPDASPNLFEMAFHVNSAGLREAVRASACSE